MNKYFSKLKQHNIKCICILGNDDMEALDDEFDNMCKKHDNVFNIDNKKIDIEDISFIGLSKVLDHPFGCKDRVVTENDLEMQRQLSPMILIDKCTNYLSIDEWYEYRKNIKHMEEVLKELPEPDANKKTIYVIHNPPYGIGLDVCANGMQVGSKAIMTFLENSNAYMSLHGHIHESPMVSGLWKNELGKTICIQAGQTEFDSKEVYYVIIDTDKNEQDRKSNKA